MIASIRLLILSTLFACACLLSAASAVSALDRCISFKREVRTATNRYLGIDFPWWYNLGQLKQESGCREGLTAFDGGQGLAQFMPATEREIEQDLGEELNLYNPLSAIKSQAYYLSKLDKQNPTGQLCYTYMFYNSGAGTVKAEAIRSACYPCHWSYAHMKKVCKRKVLTLKSGQRLSLCNVGYDYPLKVFTYGQQYKTTSDRRAFW
jgi:hypothetical protein